EREGGEGPCPRGGSCRRCAVRAGAVPAVAKPAGTGPSLPCQGGTPRLCRCTGVHVLVRSAQRSGRNLVGVHKLVGYTGLWLPTGPGPRVLPAPRTRTGPPSPSGIRSRPLLRRTQVRTTASQLSVTLRAASKRFWTSAQLTTFQKALA